MSSKRLGNVALAALICLAPLAGAPDRLLHPAPWIAFAAGALTLLTQPPLTAGELVADRTDRLSALAILLGVIGSQLAAVFQFGYRAELRPQPLSAFVVIGLGVTTFGLALRLSAIHTLGRYFTSRVHVAQEQVVIDTGPYRLLRHTSYTGTILHCLGVAIALASSAGFAVTLLLVVPAYLHRIAVEERALDAGLGQAYRAYRTRTWRLLPYLY